MTVLQTARAFTLQVDSLGENDLICVGFTGSEGISQLFHFELDCVSDQPQKIKLDKLLGKGVTLTCQLANDATRHIHGIVQRSAFQGEAIIDEKRFSRYQLTIVPTIWQMTKTANCRIFQDKTFPDIVKEVIELSGFTDIEPSLRGKYQPADYCVQYRETDFNFICRMMEEVGIYFYFKFQAGKHILVLADSPDGHADCAGHTEVKYEADAGYGEREDVIFSWQEQQELRPGKMVLRDHNFQMPSKPLEVEVPTKVKVGNNDKLEVYDYPGEYARLFNKPDARLDKVEAEGRAIVNLRMEEAECQQTTGSGSSDCRGFLPGTKFKIVSPPGELSPGPYLLTSVQHAASQDNLVSNGGHFSYSNTFSAAMAATPFRPRRLTPKPVVQGPQTAKVVGPPGEEIYPDKFGRVKVQFHWDRQGKFDENSSCWVRVAQLHAGRGFGGIDIPRIGDDVIVAFLEGDPDAPMIVGRVYNSENMPPFSLPDKKTICGIKTKTYKGDGYNELIMDDTPGDELIRIHGQYDMDSTIRHDLREHILNDRFRDVTKNETVEIGENRTETVKGGESYRVEKDRRETVSGNRHLVVKADQKEKCEGNKHVEVTGDQNDKVGGTLSQTLGALQQKVDLNYAMDAGQEIHLKAGMNLVIEATMQITLKAGANFITLGPDGISIMGAPMTKVNSGGAPGTGSGAKPQAPQAPEEAD